MDSNQLGNWICTNRSNMVLDKLIRLDVFQPISYRFQAFSNAQLFHFFIVVFITHEFLEIFDMTLTARRFPVLFNL